MKIRFIVMGFPSHQTWAEGYQRTTKEHEVHIEIVSGERWKFRMLCAAAEFESKIAIDDDIVVVDGMFDIAVLVALLKSNRPNNCPKILVYLHENQLTTPFTSQDRDKKNQTHWHYGMAHWRSLMVADGFIFNSQTHREAFCQALPKVINEQCPRDAIQWHLERAQKLLETKCTVLRYGLELDELLQMQNKKRSVDERENAPAPEKIDKKIPTILWNARLEEDKNPAAFLDLLHQVRRRKKEEDQSLLFQLIVLGTDPSTEKRWETRIRKEFSKELLFLGWCQDRKEYVKWLQKADIVISTARHETFGCAIVESVFCGAIPLLPKRLSYPELFRPQDLFENFFYSSTRGDGLEKLLRLISLVANDPLGHVQSQQKTKAAVSQFQWSVMGQVYDHFFSDIAAGEPLPLAGQKATSLVRDFVLLESSPNNATFCTPTPMINNSQKDEQQQQSAIEISKATDDRVALYRPKSLRNHDVYNHQMSAFKNKGIELALHGGRRSSVRMLEAISMGAKIRPVSFLTTPELAKNVLLPKLKDSDVPIYVTENKDLLDEIRGQKLNSGDAILSMVQFPICSSIETLIANPPILILDNVRNAENVGSILRTAFCLGITSVVASNTAWAALRDSRAARCSMGTMYYHRFFLAESLASTIQKLQAGGIHVYGVEIGERANPVTPHGPNRNWAAAMGNEDAGLSEQVASACDRIVFVPQAHGDSLNVAHAAAITMFELGRECPIPQHDGRAACT